MGDRCFMTITVHRLDAEKIKHIVDDFYPDLEEDDGLTISYDFCEANYGGYEIIEELIKANVPFYGRHTAGDQYGPMLFARMSNDDPSVDAYAVNADHGASYPIVTTGYRNGTVVTDEYMLRDAAGYYKEYEAVTKYFETRHG